MLVEMNELDKLLGNGNQFGAALDTLDPNDIQITVTEGMRKSLDDDLSTSSDLTVDDLDSLTQGREREFSSMLTEANLQQHNQAFSRDSVSSSEATTERETVSETASQRSSDVSQLPIDDVDRHSAPRNIGLESSSDSGPNNVGFDRSSNTGLENIGLQRSSNSGLQAVGFDKKAGADEPSDKGGALTYKGNCTPPNPKSISKDYPDPISRALAHLAEMIMLTLLHSTQFRTQAVFDGLAKQYQQKLQELVNSGDKGKEAAANYINERVLKDGAMDPGIQKALKNALGIPAGIKEVKAGDLSVATEQSKTAGINTGEVSTLKIGDNVCHGVKADQIAMNEKKEYFKKNPEGDGKMSYEITGATELQKKALMTMDNHSIPASAPLNASQQNNMPSTSRSASITQANLGGLEVIAREKPKTS